MPPYSVTFHPLLQPCSTTQFDSKNPMTHKVTTLPTSLMTLPNEVRIMVYESVLDNSDPFKTLYYLAQGDSRTFKTDCSDDIPWHCPVKSYRGSSSKGSYYCDACTRHKAMTMLSLFMTSRKIRNEVLPLVLQLLRRLSGVKFCVKVERHCTGWKAAVVREPEGILAASFAISRVGLTPHELLFRTKRPCFFWSANMSAWKEDLLLQGFESIHAAYHGITTP